MPNDAHAAAYKPITELTALAAEPAAGDLLFVYDTSAGEMKSLAGTYLQSVDASGNMDIAGTLTLEATSIVTDTTTGLKIGTATGQKIGFHDATPVVQQSHIADPTGGGTEDSEARDAIDAILVVLETYGLTASS